jgi:metallophosphoesterase (TIGR00282 family)
MRTDGMKVIAIGDVVGKPGRHALMTVLPEMVREHSPAIIIANGENAAGGLGITGRIANTFFAWGVDVITTGNHVWRHTDIFRYLDDEPRILRPLNYPSGAPGKGSRIFEKHGIKFGVINILGRVFMDALDCPFMAASRAVSELRREGAAIILVDFHAEATSEKAALAHYLDGMVSCVFGTHTHVQTSDARVLPGGTGFITDLGMTGPIDSVIGIVKEKAIRKFISGIPGKFDLAESDAEINYAIAEVDPRTGQTLSIRAERRKVAIDAEYQADSFGQND